MPFERIQTLLADSHYHTRFKNTSQAFQYVYTNYGYRELFRGIVPILYRNGPSNALFFIMREEAAERLPTHVSGRLNFGSFGMSSAFVLWRQCFNKKNSTYPSILLDFFSRTTNSGNPCNSSCRAPSSVPSSAHYSTH